MEFFSSRELGIYTRSQLEKKCPQEILDILSSETILAGGSVLKAITNNYETISHAPETPIISQFIGFVDRILKSKISEKSIFTTEESLQSRCKSASDYDIYTTLDPSAICDYFSNYGYEDIYHDGSGMTLDEIVKLYWDDTYSSWLMRLSKSISSGEYINLDVIFVKRYKADQVKDSDNRHYIFGTRYTRPEQFVITEFDFDICKLWFDGTDLSFMSPEVENAIRERRFSFSFHPDMTMNHHKTKTTALRIFKYRSRGFSFVGDESFLREWTWRFIWTICGYFCKSDEVIKYILYEAIVHSNEIEEINLQRNSISNSRSFGVGKSSLRYPTSATYELLKRFYSAIATRGINPGFLDKYSFPLNIYRFQNGFFMRKYDHYRIIDEFIKDSIGKYIISPDNIQYTVLSIIKSIPTRAFSRSNPMGPQFKFENVKKSCDLLSSYVKLQNSEYKSRLWDNFKHVEKMYRESTMRSALYVMKFLGEFPMDMDDFMNRNYPDYNTSYEDMEEREDIRIDLAPSLNRRSNLEDFSGFKPIGKSFLEYTTTQMKSYLDVGNIKPTEIAEIVIDSWVNAKKIYQNGKEKAVSLDEFVTEFSNYLPKGLSDFEKFSSSHRKWESLGTETVDRVIIINGKRIEYKERQRSREEMEPEEEKKRRRFDE